MILSSIVFSLNGYRVAIIVSKDKIFTSQKNKNIRCVDIFQYGFHSFFNFNILCEYYFFMFLIIFLTKNILY